MALERPLDGPPVGGVQLAGGRHAALEVAGLAVLLDHPLAERPRALVGGLLGGRELGDHLGGPDRPAEPHAGANILENVPACTTTSGPSDHSDGSEPPSNEISR